MKRSPIRLALSAVLIVSVGVASAAQTSRSTAPDAQRMDEVVRFYADDPQAAFMGVVLVARGGEVLFSKGYGMANLDWEIPHSPGTKFSVGSISKQFTAAAILLLEERGKLRVSDPIKSYLPNAPAAWNDITFHHLLSHTSGMRTGATVEPGSRTDPSRPEQIVARFRNSPLQWAPGTKFSYSNAGYQLLAYLIERVSGQRYEEFIRENMFQPLGMNESDRTRTPRSFDHVRRVMCEIRAAAAARARPAVGW